MIFHILTLFPESFSSYLGSSIMARAVEKGAVEFRTYNIADYSVKNTRRADDRPYGGFPGTIIMVEPLYDMITEIETAVGKSLKKFYLSPRGRVATQSSFESWAGMAEDCIVICGHYEGIDQRIIEMFGVEEVSIGEYVLSSGELAAMVLIDGIVRLLPGVISEDSLREESYSPDLDRAREYPQYTRPEEFHGLRVPEELTSGNHARIAEWKKKNLL